MLIIILLLLIKDNQIAVIITNNLLKKSNIRNSVYEIFIVFSIILGLILYFLTFVEEKERKSKIKSYLLNNGYKLEERGIKDITALNSSKNLKITLEKYEEGKNDNTEVNYKTVISTKTNLKIDFEIVGNKNFNNFSGRTFGSILEYDRYLVQTEQNEEVQIIMSTPYVYEILVDLISKIMRVIVFTKNDVLEIQVFSDLEDDLVILGIKLGELIINNLNELST